MKEIVRGGAFDHTLYRRPGEASAPILHVYFGGDGSPAHAIRYRPPDPTPDASLMLALMALDPSSSVYLGRPCHHGPGFCNPELWTLARYGEEVVESMAAATRVVARSVGAREVVILGYSGGGTLAMLVAERVPETRAVVTIAANLDVAAWARYHGYQPLERSLDPARRPALRPEVRQIHLAGGRDRRVPAELSRPVVIRQPGARWLLLPDFDHTCCWERVWPWLLGELEGNRVSDQENDSSVSVDNRATFGRDSGSRMRGGDARCGRLECSPLGRRCAHRWRLRRWRSCRSFLARATSNLASGVRSRRRVRGSESGA